MVVIPFPSPPSPPPQDPSPSHYDGIPAFDVHELTEDQLATMEMMGMGNADVIETRTALFFVSPDHEDEQPTIAGPHILRHHNPVVRHRDRLKVILPNGDIETLQE